MNKSILLVAPSAYGKSVLVEEMRKQIKAKTAKDYSAFIMDADNVSYRNNDENWTMPPAICSMMTQISQDIPVLVAGISSNMEEVLTAAIAEPNILIAFMTVLPIRDVIERQKARERVTGRKVQDIADILEKTDKYMELCNATFSVLGPSKHQRTLLLPSAVSTDSLAKTLISILMEDTV